MKKTKSVSLILSVLNFADAESAARFQEVADAAAEVDGYRPFNEQAILDLGAGRRTALLITTEDATSAAAIVGAAIIGMGELDLVIHPTSRRLGHGLAALEEILVEAPDQLTAWSHGDHPAARVLANRYRFAAVRSLLQLRMALTSAQEQSMTEEVAASVTARADPTRSAVVGSFRPGIDDAEWVSLNALVFAHHPEQGSLTTVDLTARQAEQWFDPGDFLIARDTNGRMIGFNWLKIETNAGNSGDAVGVVDGVGEIYVIGIHPDAAGQGLGRTLMHAGLEHLRERGCSTVALYVEADNGPAVHLYRSLGFTDYTVDVQYRRLAG